MKKFIFPLDRVLDLRQAQARVEEMKLERLYGELRAGESRERSLRDQRLRSESEICVRGETTAAELSALGAFQEYVQTQIHRSQQARAACERRLQAQRQVVTAKRQEVRLLEKLKLARQQLWQSTVEREIAQQAEESHLARWNRENIQ